jgi:hypothetical protein
MTIQSNCVEEEFADINFSDLRLTKRFIQLMKQFVSHLSYSVTRSAGDSSQAKGAYRFFANEKVEMAPILEPHMKKLIEQAKKEKKGPILNIQDTSGLNYFAHPSKKDQGHIGSSPNRPDSTGYWLHSGMVTTSDGVPLGFTYQETWAREETHTGESPNEKKSRRRKEPIENKESIRWLDGAEACLPLIREGLDVIQVADREADIFEFMQKCQELGSSFLVRSKSDRNVAVETPSGRLVLKSLHSYAAAAPKIATAEVYIEGNSDRKAQTITVSISKQNVTILVPRSNRMAHHTDGLAPIKATIILVKSLKKVAREPLNWLLLTDRKVDTVEDLSNSVKWYKARWQIEVFHKVLKSACKVEECRLSDLDRTAPYVLMKSIAAMKVMNLTYSARQNPQALASDFFAEDEWEILKMVLYQKGELGRRKPRIGEVAQKIAVRGGYSPAKNRHPGVIVMWRGWEAFQAGMDLLNGLFDNGFMTCVR